MISIQGFQTQAFDLEGKYPCVGKKPLCLHSPNTCNTLNLARDLPAGDVLSHNGSKPTGLGLVSFFFGKFLGDFRQFKA